MAGFHFIDRNGTDWMVVAGLPADFPDSGERHGPIAGLTFRAGSGEVRVLPKAAIPRRAELEDLLQHAVVWPPA